MHPDKNRSVAGEIRPHGYWTDTPPYEAPPPWHSRGTPPVTLDCFHSAPVTIQVLRSKMFESFYLYRDKCLRRVLPFFYLDEERAGDEDGGVGAAGHTDEEGEGEIADGFAAEEVQSKQWQENGQGGVDRAH